MKNNSFRSKKILLILHEKKYRKIRKKYVIYQRTKSHHH